MQQLLQSYDQVLPVYISIDEIKNHTIWKENVIHFNLEGYNFIASPALKEDISKKVYDGQSVGIPRYILMNDKGVVIEKDLPRPSTIEELKKVLDNHLKGVQ